MSRFVRPFAAAALAAVALGTATIATPAAADGWHHGYYGGHGFGRGPGIAAGIIGGLAVGALIAGAAHANERYVEPVPVYGPAPVYVEEGPRCWNDRVAQYDEWGHFVGYGYQRVCR